MFLRVLIVKTLWRTRPSNHTAVQKVHSAPNRLFPVQVESDASSEISEEDLVHLVHLNLLTCLDCNSADKKKKQAARMSVWDHQHDGGGLDLEKTRPSAGSFCHRRFWMCVLISFEVHKHSHGHMKREIFFKKTKENVVELGSVCSWLRPST